MGLNTRGRRENTSYEYDVAISFADEDRQVARQLADMLTSRGFTVFYDAYKQATLWGEDLYTRLADVYSKRSRYCIMLISRYYAAKSWTNHERRHAQARAFQENNPYILPVKLDDTVIPGIPPTVGYVDLRQSSLEIVVDLVEQKLGKDATERDFTNTSSSSRPKSDEDIGIPVPSIRRRVTQRDKDKYLRETFEVIKEYFQRGLSVLEGKYNEVETEITDIHTLKFTCKVYFDGEAKCQCKIWMGGLFKSESICYSEGRIEIDRDGTMNGWFDVVGGENTLGLQPSLLDMHLQGTHKAVFTQVEAAEVLWRRFIAPVNA